MMIFFFFVFQIFQNDKELSLNSALKYLFLIPFFI